MARRGPKTAKGGWLELAAILGSAGVGAAIGWAIAFSIRRPAGGPMLGWVWPLAILAVTVAGVVGGAFVGVVLVGLLRRDNRCPRCGTRNDEAAAQCAACDLSLRERSA